jgi:hypothetical protein
MGAALLVLVGAVEAEAAPLGPPVNRADATMTIRAEAGPAQAFEAVALDGQPMFVAPSPAVIAVELDVRAGKGNKNGFGAGEFVPYLAISYVLEPAGGGEPMRGQLFPFVGRQGLRYGNNVPVASAGPYRLTVRFEPPSATGFGRHTDLESGVSRWWDPFQVEWALDPAKVGRR